MKINIIFIAVLSIVLYGCDHPNERSLKNIFEKDKATISYSYFFNTKLNSEIENLDIKLDIIPPKTLIKELKQDNYAVKYDAVDEKKTIASLDLYLDELKNYTRYTFDFSFDSIKCKVYATEKLDVTHIIMLNKYNSKYHFINESFFVYGTVLKIIDTDIKSNDGNFDDVITEKKVVSLFDENKLFYKTEEKNRQPLKNVKINNSEAFLQMENAFLLRQFCHDALLKLKDSQADWFKEKN